MSNRRNSSLITHELLLHDAASLGDDRKLDELKLFVKRGKFDINFRDEDWGGRTALHCASEQGHLRCCKYLLEGGANPAACMTMAWTPAHCAAEGGHLSVLQLLADVGAPLHNKDEYGDTPKIVAKRYGHAQCVEFLESVEVLSEQKLAVLEDANQPSSSVAVMDNKESKEEGTVD